MKRRPQWCVECAVHNTGSPRKIHTRRSTAGRIPSYECNHWPMCRSVARRTQSIAGSKMTTSASAPDAQVTFAWPQSHSCAGAGGDQLNEPTGRYATARHAFGEQHAWARLNAGKPGGVRVKSSFPSRFCASVKQQWSLETTVTVHRHHSPTAPLHPRRRHRRTTHVVLSVWPLVRVICQHQMCGHTSAPTCTHRLAHARAHHALARAQVHESTTACQFSRARLSTLSIASTSATCGRLGAW